MAILRSIPRIFAVKNASAPAYRHTKVHTGERWVIHARLQTAKTSDARPTSPLSSCPVPGRKRLSRPAAAVSYTHLDVYKRQLESGA